MKLNFPHAHPWMRHGVERLKAKPDDEGYTLVELGMALFLLSILLTMTVIIMSTLTSATVFVNNTYVNENQLLPISTTFQSFIRDAVSPAPTLASGQAVPPFGVYNSTSPYAATTTYGSPAVTIPTLTDTSLVLYSNIGDVNGPELVMAQLTGTTFTVKVARAQANSCPGVSTGTKCTYGAPTSLLSVLNVVNPSTTPIFTYYLQGTGLVASPAASKFTNCTLSLCPASTIQDIGVDLMVNGNPGKDSQATEQNVTYELSTTSQTYDAAVG
jgi:hypothetical protein